MADSVLSEDEDFLAECEEELKHRYTDDDKEFMKVFNAEPSTPPIVESWRSQNSERRNDWRNNRHNPNERHGRQHQNNWRNQGKRSYSNYNRDCDRDDGGYRNKRPRYQYHKYMLGLIGFKHNKLFSKEYILNYYGLLYILTTQKLHNKSPIK